VIDAAPAPALQQRFEHQDQIFGFFLHFPSLSRRIRNNAPAGNSVEPGNSLSEIKRDHMLERNEAHQSLVVSGRRTKRRSCGGTGIRAEILVVAPVVSESATLKPRLGMKGKGWAGSIASGVSTGKSVR